MAGAAEREFVVDVLGGDGVGVEFAGVVEAEPFEHLLVFVVAGVGEDLFEVRVSPGAAAVLWWAGSLRGHEDRVVDVRVGIEQVFDEDLVLPVVAEVVGVAEASAGVSELTECDFAFVSEPEFGVREAELLVAEGETRACGSSPSRARLGGSRATDRGGCRRVAATAARPAVWKLPAA